MGLERQHVWLMAMDWPEALNLVWRLDEICR
jgi:hypothetical protein